MVSQLAPLPRTASLPPRAGSECVTDSGSLVQNDPENNPPSTPGSPGFSTDRLPPNTTSRGATDPSSYSDEEGEAEVDSHVLPEDYDPAAATAPDEEDEEGEDLFNDNYLE
jgi:DNA replication licensing factor MCM2